MIIININSLLNTCSQLHQLKELKRSKIIRYTAREYYYNIDFRNLIDEITNIHELTIDSCGITEVSALRNVHTFILSL